MRITVTGAGGFVGSYLVRALAARGDEVDPWTRATVDVTDPEAVGRALRRFAPGAVVHLAAQSLPTRSWDEPAETYRVNVGGAIGLLEGARALPRPPRLLLAGSSAEYAEPAGGAPLAEHAPAGPNSPYAASKLAADELARMYARRYGLDVVRFRPFFLVGPGKTGDVCSDFARRVVAIERGAPPALRVGDLNGVRDMIDVRDGAAAIMRLLDAGAAGELYNVCGGVGTRIGEIVDTYRALATVPFEVVQDPALLRPLEHAVKIGDAARLRALGWSPAYRLHDTLRAILEHARALPADPALA
jgi:GDP-4-dehydro-6-deoxy-D-mannose reductase